MIPIRNRARRASLPLAAVLGLLLAACGNDEHSPGHAEPGPPASETSSQAYKDPNDSATTKINLTTSGQHDAEANTVKVYATIKDQDGVPLTSLNKYNFSVRLNPASAPRIVDAAAVTLSTEVADDRLVALVIDSSGSMTATDPTTGQSRIQAAQSAAKLYVDNMADGDFAAVVAFSSDARTVQPLTSDKALLIKAIDSLQADGATNFGAAISRSVEAVGSRPGKRAMILLTDGDDTVDSVTGGPTVWLGNSLSTRDQGLTAAQQNEFRIYTVGLGTDLSDTGLADLQTFADLTGGSFFLAPTTSALATPFSQTIPNEIEGLPPMETLALTFPNPYSPASGGTTNVTYGVSVSYQNANGRLSDYATGTYQVP